MMSIKTNFLFSKSLTLSSFFLGFLILTSIFHEIHPEAINKTFIGKKAIDGYDVVNYFKEKTARPGKKEYVHEWKGARWFFIDQGNLDEFKKHPEKYLPRYGGYCAFAASKGEKVQVDPEVFDIYEGHLYFNYDRSVQKKWQEDKKGFISKADELWPIISK